MWADFIEHPAWRKVQESIEGRRAKLVEQVMDPKQSQDEVQAAKGAYKALGEVLTGVLRQAEAEVATEADAGPTSRLPPAVQSMVRAREERRATGGNYMKAGRPMRPGA